MSTGFYSNTSTDGITVTPPLLSEPFSGVLKTGNAVIGRVVVENQPTSLSINNLPGTQRVEVSNFPTNQRVTVANQPTKLDVTVLNQVADQQVHGTLSIDNFPNLQKVELTGSSSVLATLAAGSQHIGSVSLNGPITGRVVVENQPTSLAINNFPTSFGVSGGSIAISNFPAQPTALRINNDVSQPIPVAIVSGSAGGGGGSFDGNVTVKGGSLSLSAPVSLASGTSVGITGPVGVSNFPSSFSISGTSKVTVENIVPVTLASVPLHPVTVQGDTTVKGTVNIGNFPVVQTIRANETLPVSGTVTAQFQGVPTFALQSNAMTVTNALKIDTSTAALRVEVVNQTSGGGSTGGSVTVSNFPATQPVSLADPITIANPVTSLAINNLPDTQKVSIANAVTIANPVTSVAISNLPATQPVSIANAITVANPVTSVAINNLPATQAVSLADPITVANPVTSVAINNFPATQPVSIAGTVPTTVSGPVTTTPTRSAPAVTWTDISGTITNGGIYRGLMGADTNRRGGWIQNLSNGDLWISDLGNATIGGSSLRIPAGAMYEFPVTGVPTAAFTIIGASTGQAWSGRVF